MYKDMGYIKEPEGIDFYVDSKPLSENDKKEISDIIAYYRLTGRKKRISTTSIQRTVSIRKSKSNQLVK
jgi:hypothetical protein